MRTYVAAIAAGAALAAVCAGADAARCRLRSGLYEQRLAMASAPRPPNDPGGSAAGDGPAAAAATAARAALDREYRDFLRELTAAGERKDGEGIKTCCAEIGEDRIGALSCQLVSYVAGGRSDAAGFLTAFPSGKKDLAALWELDALAAGALESGAAVPRAFLPHGPGYRFVDELFLLVLDGREEAINKYLGLSALATPEAARYLDGKLALLFREAPAVLVSNWFALRRYKQKLKSVAETIAANASPAEVQKIRKGIQAFCSKDDPDCDEILKMLGKR